MITNPKWMREINIAKVRIELLKTRLQMEFNNGNLQNQNRGQPTQSGDQIRSQPPEVVTEQRNQIPNNGTDYQNTE